MWKYIFVLALVPILAFSQSGTPLQQDSIKKVILGKIQFGPGADSLSDFKFEAAFNIALSFAKNYRLVPTDYRDSVISSLKEHNSNVTMIDIANECDADIIAVANIGILKNMMRVDLTLADISNRLNYRGVGYDLLNYRKIDEKPLYDPTLVTATQRAFADALENDSLYKDAPEDYRVLPAAPLVVGGIEFINDLPPQDSLMTWDLFAKKEINSFDVCESIFEQAALSKNFATYDLDTRDSLYAMLNLFGTENYTPPTSIEIFGLAKIEVEYYITGKLTQLPFAARLELSLFRINAQGGIFEINNVKGLLKQDSIDELRKVTKKLTQELLEPKLDEE